MASSWMANTNPVTKVKRNEPVERKMNYIKPYIFFFKTLGIFVALNWIITIPMVAIDINRSNEADTLLLGSSLGITTSVTFLIVLRKRLFVSTTDSNKSPLTAPVAKATILFVLLASSLVFVQTLLPFNGVRVDRTYIHKTSFISNFSLASAMLISIAVVWRRPLLRNLKSVLSFLNKSAE